MSDPEEVRAMEIVDKLVRMWLCGLTTSSINTSGAAIAELANQCDNVEEIRAVGDLLESLTEQDRSAIWKGEPWGNQSRQPGRS
jgi:hypothetical protein